MAEFFVWLVTAALCTLLISDPWLHRNRPDIRWKIVGYPATAVRIFVTWRRVALLTDLSVSKRPNRQRMGNMIVKGEPIRVRAPRLGFPKPTRDGLKVEIRLHPGQTPAPFLASAEALEHAWRVHSVRVVSPDRGRVIVTARARDPLLNGEEPKKQSGPLVAKVGSVEEGTSWEINFHAVAHWLVAGATTSGKSNFLSALLGSLSEKEVALVGVDCKGGLELSTFDPRLSALATDRPSAARMLNAVVEEIHRRMTLCRGYGVNSIWKLSDFARPAPIVIVVDEIAELYLNDGSREAKRESAECSTSLLRIAQLGAALGVHLVVSGQRIGAEMGSGVTALRAQLGGRVCHRVNDAETAVMTLGDMSEDALIVAQSISPEEKGVAVTATHEGRWVRARAIHVDTAEARQHATAMAHFRQPLPGLVAAVESGE